MENLSIKSSNQIKILKQSYLNWFKNGVEDNLDDYFSITLHLNPFNRFRIYKRVNNYDFFKNKGEEFKSEEEMKYIFWRNMNNDGYFVEWGSREKYSKCLKKFLNKLNDGMFGNNWNRRNEGISFCLSFFESKDGNINKNLLSPHYHIIIKKPSTISELKFRSLIINRWGFWNFKFNKKFKNRSGEIVWEDKFGFIRSKKVLGVFDTINIKKFYRKDSGYDFIDYGLKEFDRDINKVDLRNSWLSK